LKVIIRNLLGRFVKLPSEVKKKIFESMKALITSVCHPGQEENDSSESSVQQKEQHCLDVLP
jgi:hypothetical protein